MSANSSRRSASGRSHHHRARGRNTAPAIAAAAALLRTRDPLWRDAGASLRSHLSSTNRFQARHRLRRESRGSRPPGDLWHRPHRPGDRLWLYRRGSNWPRAARRSKIIRFVENTDLATALEYLADGAWTWNSGMFVFPVGLLLDELWPSRCQAWLRARFASVMDRPSRAKLCDWLRRNSPHHTQVHRLRLDGAYSARRCRSGQLRLERYRFMARAVGDRRKDGAGK